MYKANIDPRYLIRPYYLRPDGKVGHDAFAVIRETIREMNKVAIGRIVLTNREHIIALEPMDKGLVGTLLRYPYEVRSEQEYFEEIQDDLAPKFYPGLSSFGRLDVLMWAVVAAGAGAEPSTQRSARSRRGLQVEANSDGVLHPSWECGRASL